MITSNNFKLHSDFPPHWYQSTRKHQHSHNIISTESFPTTNYNRNTLTHYQVTVLLHRLIFFYPKAESCFGYCRNLRKYITNENHGLLENARDPALITKTKRSTHKGEQGHLQCDT